MEPDEPADRASQPFVAPASFEELDRAALEASQSLAAAPERRPAHLLVLQLCVSADLFFSALGMGVSFARVLAQGTLFRANPLVWLIRPVTVTALSLALVLALSRSLPKPLLVCRFAGINWWFYVLYRTLSSVAQPRPSELHRLLFEGVSPALQRAVLGVVDFLLLLLVLTLFLHAPTRAYLSGGSSANGSQRDVR